MSTHQKDSRSQRNMELLLMAHLYQEHKRIKLLEDEQENINIQKNLKRALYELKKLYSHELNRQSHIDSLVATMHMTLFVECLNKGFMPELGYLESTDDLESAESLMQDAETTLNKLKIQHGTKLNEAFEAINLVYDELLSTKKMLVDLHRETDKLKAFINNPPEYIDDSLLVKPEYPEGSDGFFSRTLRSLSFEWSKLSWNSYINRRRLYDDYHRDLPQKEQDLLAENQKISLLEHKKNDSIATLNRVNFEHPGLLGLCLFDRIHDQGNSEFDLGNDEFLENISMISSKYLPESSRARFSSEL